MLPEINHNKSNTTLFQHQNKTFENFLKSWKHSFNKWK